MSNFLYFIANAASQADCIKKAGLEYAFETPPSIRETQKGPDNLPGLLLANTADGEVIDYDPATQNWQPHPALPGVYLGYNLDNPPTEADLLRSEWIYGYTIELADNDWIVPTVRKYPEGSELPSAIALVDGKVTYPPKACYREICEQADRVWDQVRRDQGMLEDGEVVEELTDEEELQIAAAALGVNYRVSVAELAILEMLDTKTLSYILYFMVDFPRFARDEKAKKNSPPSSDEGNESSTSGQPG